MHCNVPAVYWERLEEGLGETGGGTGRDGRRDWERREEGLGETGGGTGRGSV